MPEPLNPRYLVPDISLNRARMIMPPEIAVPDHIAGQTAHDLVSAQAVFQQIQQHSAVLGIAPELLAMLPHPVVFSALDACFESEDAVMRAAAQQIGHALGQNLGYLLLMLRRGDAISRVARPEWHDSYWAHWGRVGRIWLGGGLIRGHLRDTLLADIRRVFDAAATPPPQLALDPYGVHLPLVGAARCGLADHTALVLDFGSTAVKRGLAVYEHGTLVELDALPEISTPWYGDVHDKPAIKAFFEFMTQTLVDTFKRATPRSSLIPVSIAAYLTPQGRPLDRQGAIYAALNQLGMNLQAQLSSAVRHTVGRSLDIKLIHDGTAAATVYPGDAVITLGTSIGVGLGTAVDNPVPIADNFRVID